MLDLIKFCYYLWKIFRSFVRPINKILIIDISINMDESSLTMRSVFSPLASILCTIRPGLLPKSISEATFPLSGIDCTSLELVWLSLLTWLIWIVESL